ncbi:hypothetical protein [Luteolibacter sp. AS25]|uniref:hypothetical protein n=1 Tax=Luteolibacter sp. AS25 TaxID=3135776 RepID=UPI00398AFB9A
MFKTLLLLLLAATGLNAQQTLFRKVFHSDSDTHVEAVALFSSPSLGGFMPVRVVVANNQKIPHRIYLDFENRTSHSDGLSTSSTFNFFAPPGKTVTQDILVPLAPQNGSHDYQSFKVSLGGSMGSDSDSLESIFSKDQPAVLLSESLYTVNGSALNTEQSSRTTSYRGGSNQEFAASFSPKQLPDDWRAFSGYDTIMLSSDDWSEVPPGPRNAIFSWLRLGGQLVIFTKGSSSVKMLGLPEDTSFGQIILRSISNDLRMNEIATVNIPNSERSAKPRAQAATSDFIANWPIQEAFGEKSFRYIYFVIILIAFGILVAPVNLFVFAKSGQRHRLFITTPLISLGTSLVLVVLIILQDGFGGDGTRIVLMEVRPDDNQNAAFLHQEQFSRTGVITSPGFTLDASALITPVPIDQSRWARLTNAYDSNGAYNLQPSGGKLFAKGEWFQSRSEQGQVISAVVPTRGRIEATKSDALVSTFDFTIDTLLYLSQDGAWFRADNITKGKPVDLTEIDPTMALPLINETAKKFSERNKSFLNNVRDRQDHFIALTSSAPAIETHTGIDWDTQTVITGPIAR